MPDPYRDFDESWGPTLPRRKKLKSPKPPQFSPARETPAFSPLLLIFWLLAGVILLLAPDSPVAPK
jgi:hypothetical protein